MRGVGFFIFLITLPVLLALGFDGYMWYSHGQGPFVFYTVGYIWEHFDPVSLKSVAQNLSPIMRPYFDLIISQKAAVDGAVFAGFFYLILILLKVLKWWPFNNQDRYDPRTRAEKILGKKPEQFNFKRR